MSKLNGIINVRKPPGITSFRAVSYVKKKLSCRKAGHTGTLDPAAVGVLPVCVGKATKVIPYIPDDEKEYIAEITLGIVTDTLDSEGEILEKNDEWHEINVEKINQTLNKFIGTIEQIPPMYSAVHHNGKRLYQLARQGKKVQREPREVEIKEIELLELDLPILKIRVLCSKGTYIRTLADDIGKSLNVGAHLSSLHRSRSGSFTIENAVTLEELQKIGKKALLPIDFPLRFPKLFIKECSLKKAENGTVLSEQDILVIPGDLDEKLKYDNRVSIYFENIFISIDSVKKLGDNSMEFKPLRVFNIFV